MTIGKLLQLTGSDRYALRDEGPNAHRVVVHVVGRYVNGVDREDVLAGDDASVSPSHLEAQNTLTRTEEQCRPQHRKGRSTARVPG